MFSRPESLPVEQGSHGAGDDELLAGADDVHVEVAEKAEALAHPRPDEGRQTDGLGVGSGVGVGSAVTLGFAVGLGVGFFVGFGVGLGRWVEPQLPTPLEVACFVEPWGALKSLTGSEPSVGKSFAARA